MVKDLAWIPGAQQCGSLGCGFCHQHPAFSKATAALFQGKGDICQIHFWVGVQIVRQGCTIGVERGSRLPGQAEHMEGKIAFFGRAAFRGLFQNGMGIGAPHPQRVDPGAAWTAV